LELFDNLLYKQDQTCKIHLGNSTETTTTQTTTTAETTTTETTTTAETTTTETTTTAEPTTTAYSGPGAQLYGGTSSVEVVFFTFFI
jgi:hypothetical protein